MLELQAVDLKEFFHRPRLPNEIRRVDHPEEGGHVLGVIGGNPVAPVAGVERRQRRTLRGSCPWLLAFLERPHGRIRGHNIFQVLDLAKPE